MQKLIRFIKYNNAFTIIISLIMFSTAGAFANEKVRDTVIGQTIVTRIGTDNTQIISADLDSFDMGLKIKSVKEDDKFYYVNFDYNAIDVKDGVWQTAVKEKNINVLKARLGDMDLGVYLAEELKQLTDKERAYMKEVQSIEKNKGLQKQVESVKYTGLKGLVFDNETKEILGYSSVKEEEKDKTIIIDAAALTIKAVGNKEEDNKNEKEEGEKIVQQITVVKETVSKETIMEMVREVLAQEQGSGNSSALPASSSSSSVSTSVSGGGSGGVSAQSSSDSSSSQPPSESSSSSEAISSSSEASSAASSENSASTTSSASSSETVSSGSAESSSSSVESSSASSTSDVLPSQSSSSTSDVIPAESSSSSSSAVESSSSSVAI